MPTPDLDQKPAESRTGFFKKRFDRLKERREENKQAREELNKAEELAYRQRLGEARVAGKKAAGAAKAERVEEEGYWGYHWKQKTRTFRRFFGNTAKVMIAIAAVILIIGIFTSDAKSAVWIRSQTQLDRLDPLINTIKTKYSPTAAFNKYVLGISTFEPPDKAPESKPSTIHLEDIRSIARTIYEKDKIIMIGTAKIDQFNIDSAKVSFSCNLENSDPAKLYLTGKKDQEDQDSIVIKKNTAKTISFTCELPPIDKVEGKGFDTKVVNFNWYFEDFTTVTDIDLIAMNRQSIIDAENANQDPIKEFRNSDIIDSKDYAKDICVRNCYLSELALDINSEMPLADDTEYILAIRLVNLFERSTRGKVKSLKSIQLITPQDRSIEASCPDFGPDNLFESSDSEFAPVNDAIMKQINEDKANKNSIELFCKIKIAQTEEFPTIKKLRAIAVYDYGDAVKVPIVVEKRPEALSRTEKGAVS